MMAKVAWLNGAKAASMLAVAGLLLGFALTAPAQTDPTKPKVAAVKPGDPAKKPEDKPADPKKTETPKTTATPTPSTSEPTTPTSGGPSGFSTKDEATKLIDEYLAAAWKENKITPAERCSDYEFIRRATLDLNGRIATVGEVERFMKDPPASRREKLIDRLLYDRDDKNAGGTGIAGGKGNPEFASSWATMWTHWLMTRTGTQLYKRQMHLWLEDYFLGETQSYKSMVEQLVTAKGKTNENGAVNFALANLGATNQAGKQGAEGAFDAVPLTARTVRLFLGYQIQCTQCHDHPFNADWKQKHFWGVNVFFRQLARDGTPPMQQGNNMMMNNVVLGLGDSPNFNTKGIIFYEKRNGVFLPSEPVFVDGRRIPAGSQLSRREELARFITSHKNFDRAAVNRVWGHLFGRGMNVKPQFDDFGEHNEVVHDELLTKLGQQFAGSGAHDVRKLIKWITASDAYNLKSIANSTNASPEMEPYFARMNLKMMSPEQLLESLITATKTTAGDNNGEVRDAQRRLRDQWLNVLTRNFGDDEGNEISYNGTILQALLMMNGRDLNAAINTNGSGTVKEAAKFKSGKQTMDYLFLATLNRPSTQKEYTQVMGKLPIKAKDDGSGPLQDLFWALLNCNEFILNH